MCYEYVTTDEEEYGKKEPDKGSGDDELQLERAIQAWNNGNTDWIDITMSNDKDVPRELHKIRDEPPTKPSSNNKIEE